LIGIRHTGIYVIDLEKMKDFYCAVLGMDIAVHAIEKGSYISTVLALEEAELELYKLQAKDGSMLELLSFGKGKEKKIRKNIWEAGQYHIAVTVGDLDREYIRLSELGIPFISPPQISPDGYAKMCFCQDPEGNYIELVEVLK
jgi:catechol 2,3-dioxygenase-like lactoylglutathione lyase family enzyme